MKAGVEETLFGGPLCGLTIRTTADFVRLAAAPLVQNTALGCLGSHCWSVGGLGDESVLYVRNKDGRLQFQPQAKSPAA